MFNELEAKKVLQVVKQLQMSSISLKDIGIITPYKAQVSMHNFSYTVIHIMS